MRLCSLMQFFLNLPFTSLNRSRNNKHVYLQQLPPSRQPVFGSKKRPNLTEKSTYYTRVIVVYKYIRSSPSLLFTS